MKCLEREKRNNSNEIKTSTRTRSGNRKASYLNSGLTQVFDTLTYVPGTCSNRTGLY